MKKINNFLIKKFRVRIIGGSVCEYEIPNYYCIRFIDHWYSTKYWELILTFNAKGDPYSYIDRISLSSQNTPKFTSEESIKLTKLFTNKDKFTLVVTNLPESQIIDSFTEEFLKWLDLYDEYLKFKEAYC